jgi:hypothetical protein
MTNKPEGDGLIRKGRKTILCATSLLVALAIYAAAYGLTVEQWSYSPFGRPRSSFYMFPEYRPRSFGMAGTAQSAAQAFFYPAFMLDSVIRPKSWHPSGFRSPDLPPSNFR